MIDIFNEEYKKLNKAQKDAVDSIDGPVMVVAGPGTGKTQILALRIGNILKETDTKADGILCLTFTNSGVKAMRERLRKYIGGEASKIKIATFHSFGMDMIEKYFLVLGLEVAPKLLDEKDAITLCDYVLENNSWEYIRPRSDTARYFRDLKSLISLLKRERIAPESFRATIETEIEHLKNDEGSISSRGPSKGELKKEVQNKIEGLARALESVKFYELYEAEKEERGVFDYDDVLENLVKIVEESEVVKEEIREEFLYILIDEHQDSSGVQNEFLQKVWGDTEKPNIFVVGDDRQLIYGFGGASLQYFENFKHTFGKAKLITLIENYRSTQNILDSSHQLLQSSLVEEKLKSNHKENHPIHLVEAEYPRDEVIIAGLEIKKILESKKDINPNGMAILVPKNRQVRSAIVILKDMGIPVSGGREIDFFDVPEAYALMRVLKILAHPEEGTYFAESFFDKYSGISPFTAHKFLQSQKMRNFSLLEIEDKKNNSLFEDKDEIEIWVSKLKSWLESEQDMSLYSLIQKIGGELLTETAKSHEELVLRVEVVRTILHLVLAQIEKPARPIGGDKKLNLKDFVLFLERMEAYGEHMPMNIFSKDEGVKVLTLHGSKGLEFDFVWIAHMDERSLSSTKHGGFTLPESIKEKADNRDEEVLRRQLYVAITRAKRFCTISYALHSYTGGEQTLASIVADLEENFEKQTAMETEKKILDFDPKAYIAKDKTKIENTNLEELVELVRGDYEDHKVSVSLLNNFFECPWKWYFRNLLQLPGPKSESLEFGNIIHASIDQILKLHKIPKEVEIKEIIEKEIHKSGFGTLYKQKELNDLALKTVSHWVEYRLGEISKDRENEQSVSVRDELFPHLSIYGKIDMIEKLNNTEVRVTDFKTGSPRKKSDIEKEGEDGRMSDYMRQLSMYSYLLTQNPKWNVDVAESRLEFVEAKKETESFYDTHITGEQIEMIRKDIEDYDNALKNGTWINMPCHYKSYGKANTVCEYCAMAEIYK